MLCIKSLRRFFSSKFLIFEDTEILSKKKLAIKIYTSNKEYNKDNLIVVSDTWVSTKENVEVFYSSNPSLRQINQT